MSKERIVGSASLKADGVHDLLAACAVQMVASNSVSLKIRTATGRQILGGLLPAT